MFCIHSPAEKEGHAFGWQNQKFQEANYEATQKQVRYWSLLYSVGAVIQLCRNTRATEQQSRCGY
jgi:hypothetical protein